MSQAISNWNSYNTPERRDFFLHQQSLISSLIEYLCPRASRVLELGAGFGFRAIDLVNRLKNCKFMVTDISPDTDLHEDVVGKRSDIVLEKADCTKLQYEDNSFDVTFAVGLFSSRENSQIRRSGISEAFRVSRRGIVLIDYLDSRSGSDGTMSGIVTECRNHSDEIIVLPIPSTVDQSFGIMCARKLSAGG